MFGRAAMGEAVEQGAFTDRWRVRRDGRLVFAETVRLDGAIARMLARAGGGRRRRRHRHRARGAGRSGDGRAGRARKLSVARSGISAWNGLAVARLCAKDGASLRRDLVTVIAALGGTLPRLWLN